MFDIGGGIVDMCVVFVDIIGDLFKYVVCVIVGDFCLGGIDFDERFYNIMVRKKVEDLVWNFEDVKKFFLIWI